MSNGTGYAACLMAGVLTLATAAAADPHAQARREMVVEIEQNVLDTSRYLGRERLSPAVRARH